MAPRRGRWIARPCQGHHSVNQSNREQSRAEGPDQSGSHIQSFDMRFQKLLSGRAGHSKSFRSYPARTSAP